MADANSEAESPLAAGDFSSWLADARRAIRGEQESVVPCGGCTACCTSSQFIHIAPDETDTLSHIPPDLLFPAPRLPRGHVVLGYDEQGHCPMLTDNQCSIYEHRPRTCRTYDCRIFPAAAIEADANGDSDKVPIGRQARRWQFSYPTEADKTEHKAVRAATTFLGEHPDLLPDKVAPTGATRLAVLAIEIYDVFLVPDEEAETTTIVDPDPDLVRMALMRRIEPGDAT